MFWSIGRLGDWSIGRLGSWLFGANTQTTKRLNTQTTKLSTHGQPERGNGEACRTRQIGTGEGLPSVTHKSGIRFFGAGQDNVTSFDNGGGGMEALPSEVFKPSWSKVRVTV